MKEGRYASDSYIEAGKKSRWVFQQQVKNSGLQIDSRGFLICKILSSQDGIATPSLDAVDVQKRA